MIRRARRALELISALLVTGLVLVTVVDVVGRYLFNAPLAGAFEITQLLLGALVFAALPLTTAKGAHIEVDLLLPLLPGGVSHGLARFAGVVTAFVFVFFAWRLALLTKDHLAAGTRTSGLGLPLWGLGVTGVASTLVCAAIAARRRR
jgi:TRAP-type C4-dicarboxylate transport system permease small subunit